jgi:autotransporter-associated beta strand protein
MGDVVRDHKKHIGIPNGFWIVGQSQRAGDSQGLPRSSLWLYLVVASLGLVARDASAATSTWDGGSNGSGTAWDTPANWNLDNDPASGNDLLFNNVNSPATVIGGGGVLTLGSSRNVGLITFDNANGKLPGTLGVDTKSSGSTSRDLTVATGITLQNTTTNNVTFTGNPGTLNYILSGNNTFNISSGGTLQFNSNVPISGAFGVTKSGAGTLTLLGGNTYSGVAGTTISNGTLLANNNTGSATGTQAVTVQSGGRLGGNGIISGSVDLSGTISPGAAGTTAGTGSFGTLATASQTWKAGGKYEVELNAVSPVATHDQVALANLTQPTSGTFAIQVIEVGGGSMALNQWITIASSSTGVITGGFNASKFILTDLTHSSQYFSIRAQGDGADGIVNASGGFTVEIEALSAPEPGSALLFGAGLSTLLLARRRRAEEACAQVTA